MDFTILKNIEKTESFQPSKFLHLGLKLGMFGYMCHLALMSWSFLSFIYVGLLFYWICNFDAMIKQVVYELVQKKKATNQYSRLIKISFANPHIRFYYKFVYLILFVIILKVFGSFVGSMNYVSSNSDAARLQLMRDFDVSMEENKFTFKTLVLNLSNELCLLLMIIVILYLEKAIIPYTKEELATYIGYYGLGTLELSRIGHCLLIFAIPVVSKTPLSMLPLLGLLIALLLIFYKQYTYIAVLYIPELFLCSGTLLYLFLKVESIGVYTPFVKPWAKFFCSYGDSSEAQLFDKIYIFLCICIMAMFRAFRYVHYFIELKKVSMITNALAGLLLNNKKKNKHPKKKAPITAVLKPDLVIKEVDEEEEDNEDELPAQKLEMEEKKPQEMGEVSSAPKEVESEEVEEEGDSEEDPKTGEEAGAGIEERPFSNPDSPEQQLKPDKLTMSTVARKRRRTDITLMTKDTDPFSTFFLKNFDQILKINRNDALNLKQEIRDPIILELKDYVNLARLRDRWAQYKIYTVSEKIKLRLLRLWESVASLLRFLVMEVMLTVIVSIFRNRVIIILIETVLAILYVIYSERSPIVYPMMLWVFTNIYPRFDSALNLNMKIWMVMVPTGINCLISKNRTEEAAKNSINLDFNFTYKAEFRIFDISTLGVLLIAFVMLEMISMSEQGKKKAVDDALIEKKGKRSVWMAFGHKLLKMFISNSIYLVVINLYLIAININLINLGLIVFFIRLILKTSMDKSLIYSLFIYNQVSIFSRYTWYLVKGWFNLNSLSPSTQDLIKLIGLEEDNTIGIKSELLKTYLNYSLQIFLIIIIFKFRNENLFKKFEVEVNKDNKHSKKNFRLEQSKRLLKNLVDLGQYTLFHCSSWIAYLVIFMAMVITSTTLVTLIELLFLAFVMMRHLRYAVDLRFGGIVKIAPWWKFLLGLSATTALGRYILWFSTYAYIRNNVPLVNGMYNFIMTNLSFIGLIPQQQSEAFLELLPGFLTMYWGALFLRKVEDVEFALKHESEIKQLDMEDYNEIASISGVDINLSRLSIRGTRPRSSSLASQADNHANEINEPLNEEEVKEIRHKERLMSLRKMVFGDILIFRRINHHKLYFFMKSLIVFNFFTVVYLSIKFRVGLAMWVILFLNMLYFWKSHNGFIDSAIKQNLDSKILNSNDYSNKGLKIFYQTFVSKKGLVSCDTSSLKMLIGSDMDRQLKGFKMQIRYDDMKRRQEFFRLLPIFTSIILVLCYLSKFSNRMQSYLELQKWMNNIMVVLGTLIHSKNKLVDVYGYLIVIYLTIAELTLSRNLKEQVKDKLRKYYIDKRPSDEEEPMSAVIINLQPEVSPYLIKIKGEDPQPFQPATEEHELESEEEPHSVYMKLDSFRPFRCEAAFIQLPEGEARERESLELDAELDNLLGLGEGPQQGVGGNEAIPKLLYYFENKNLYLNCKMYYGLIYLMFRLSFFILISMSDSIDCLLSWVALVCLAYIWYADVEQPMLSVKSINKLAVVVISVKYLIGCLNIQRSNYVGDALPFETSLVLMFLSSTENKNYYYFDRLITKSLADYWLFYEASIFVAIHLLIFLYGVILQLNTSFINTHIKSVQQMVRRYITADNLLSGQHFYVNFDRWYTPQVKFSESFLKVGTVYLPVLSVVTLVGVSQLYASIPIVAIVILAIFVIYMLIFKWLYKIIEKRDEILKHFHRLNMLIWAYIIIGSLSRIFARAVKDRFPNFNPLGNITFIIVICLISFQVLKDLWTSVDFKRFYKEVLNKNKVSKILVPLCEAFEFNEQKLGRLVRNLKSKESLDRRIKVMEKQLKLWHYKFAKKDQADASSPGINEHTCAQWEKEIADLDNEEENIVLEIRNEDTIFEQVGMLDKIINYGFLTFVGQLRSFTFSPQIYMMNYVKSKNSEICKDIDFKIYDYICDEYDDYIKILQGIMAFYADKEQIKAKVEATRDKYFASGRESAKASQGEKVEDKPLELLKQCADIFHAKLIKPRDNISVDLSENMNKDEFVFFDSKVNDITIRFFNIMSLSQNDLKVAYRLTNWQKLTYIIWKVPSFILANFQGITLTVLIIYCLLNPSLIKLVLLVHVILNGITEELNLDRKFWKYTFIIISAIFCLKMAIKSLFILDRQGELQETYSPFTPTLTINSMILFFCGNISYDTWEVLAFLFTILRILQSQYNGYFEKYALEFENISTAFLRIKINKKFKELWQEEYNSNNEFLTVMEKLVQSQEEKVRAKKFDFSLEKSLLESEEIALMISKQNSLIRDEKLYKEMIRKIEDKMVETYYDYPIEFIKDDTWRVFSKYNRKTGMDFYLWATLIQLLILVIIFAFYNQMEEPSIGSGSTLNSLNGDRFSGKMTILLFCQVGFIIFERYLFLTNPKDWMNWEVFKSDKKTIKDPKIFMVKNIVRNLENLTPKERLSKVFKRTAFLVSLFNCTGDQFFKMIEEARKHKEVDVEPSQKKLSDYQDNPLYKRLRFIKILMGFFYTLMFIVLPIQGNLKTSGKMFCSSVYLPTNKPKCNHVFENVYIHMFFVFNSLYFVLSALQINKGESFLKNQKKKNQRWSKTEKITNTIVTKVPFIFEIKTALDFAVTNTGLGLFEWFKFEDIFNTFFAAKYDQLSSDMKRLGVARSKIEKIIFGWIALFIFLLLVLAPIFIFSNFNPDSVPNTVQSLETTVGIKIDYSKFVLYTNSNPKSISPVSEDIFTKKIMPFTNKININSMDLYSIELYPFGDSNWSITSDMYTQLRNLLIDTLTQHKTAYLYYSLKMSQKNNKVSLYTKETLISSQILLDIHEMLTKCNTNKIYIPSFYYQIIKMNPTTGIELFPLENNSFNKTVELKASCSKAAGTTSSVEYWMVSNDNGDSKNKAPDEGMNFYVILDNYSKSLAMFTSVVAMYTGFVLIVGNVIRGAFTGQTTKIWTTDVPKAEQIIRICEGITAARVEGDIMREEILYWELIDIMRSPEMIKLISQNYLEHKKKLEKVHQRNNTAV